MTIGHFREITKHLPDDMLVMVPISVGSNSVILPVCNKSRVRRIHLDENENIETVLMLEPCICDFEIIEGQEELAHNFIINDAIDN